MTKKGSHKGRMERHHIWKQDRQGNREARHRADRRHKRQGRHGRRGDRRNGRSDPEGRTMGR
ncbi:MAG: hypothetical protein MZV70_59455 [Desulfobacterales bacterium]|nr:hypothetical protein [Desulfobacterales bacterium]